MVNRRRWSGALHVDEVRARESYATRFREARERLGLNQIDVAIGSGIGLSTYEGYERAERLPRVDYYIRLRAFFADEAKKQGLPLLDWNRLDSELVERNRWSTKSVA